MPRGLFAASAETEAWLQALRRLSVEDVLLPLLVQLALIILAARLFAILFRRLRQPAVVGEIVAGLVLGPSVFGRLFPNAFEAVFRPPLPGLAPELGRVLLGWILTALSQLGLVFLLFLIGLEFDFSHLRRHGRSALAIALAGIAAPFALGLGLASVLHPRVAADIPPLGFALFLGTALSITAIPVLGRIMLELGITRTRLGALTIAAAAVDDAAGWILLASVAAVVRAAFDPTHTLLMLAETVAFTLLMVFAARPVLLAWARRALRRGDGGLGVNALAVLGTVLFGCAIVTDLIGVFAVFGAFVLGAVLSGEEEFRRAVGRRLGDFVTAYLLPVYFAYTGLRTDVGNLGSWDLWLLCALVVAAGVVGKVGGCGLAAWLSGSSRREAACVGALMNARGLMALVVINLGKDLGVVPDSVFSMLVLMALLTTVVTTPAVLRLMWRTELEAHVLGSGFLGKRPAPQPVEGRQAPAAFGSPGGAAEGSPGRVRESGDSREAE
jgi:Kef-type K+ transport system membrane component KefB